MIIKRYIVQLMHNETGKWIDVYSTSGKMGKRVKFKTIQKAQDCMNEFKKMNN